MILLLNCSEFASQFDRISKFELTVDNDSKSKSKPNCEVTGMSVYNPAYCFTSSYVLNCANGFDKLLISISICLLGVQVS